MPEEVTTWNLYKKLEEDDVASSQPSRPKKRAGLEDDETDETTIEYDDTCYPVAADYPYRLRFQACIRSLIDISEENMLTAQ